MELQMEADLGSTLCLDPEAQYDDLGCGSLHHLHACSIFIIDFQGALAPFSQYGLTDNPNVADNRKVRANYAGLNDLNNTYQTL